MSKRSTEPSSLLEDLKRVNESLEMVRLGDLFFLEGLFENWSTEIEQSILATPKLLETIVAMKRTIEAIDPESRSAESELNECVKQIRKAFLHSKDAVGSLIVSRKTRRGSTLMGSSIMSRRGLCVANLTLFELLHARQKIDYSSDLWQTGGLNKQLKGKGLPKKESSQKPDQGVNVPAVDDEDVAKAISTIEQADGFVLDEVLSKFPAATQQALATTFSGAAERQRRKDVLGLDLHDLSREQSIMQMNDWFYQHTGDFAESSNKAKEEIVNCLRGIRDELDAQFVRSDTSEEKKESITLITEMEKNGKIRFTARRSGGLRRGVMSRQGLPPLQLE